MPSITPGWNGWPTGFSRTDPKQYGSHVTETYTEQSAWAFIIQATLALREREAALGGGSFPPVAEIWATGTVDSITVNDDGTAGIFCGEEVNWQPPTNCSTQRWVNYSCTACSANTFPSTYDVIINLDRTDPLSTVRATITGQSWTSTNEDGSGPGTLIIDAKSFTNAVTAGYIPSLDSLEGKKFYIMRKGSPWESDRMFDKPDGIALSIGYDSTGGTTTAWAPAGTTAGTTTYSYLTDTSKLTAANIYYRPTWKVDQWKDKQLLVFDTAGVLHRQTILGNDDSTLYFAHQTWTGAGHFRVVKVGTVGTPGRTIGPLLQWYTGASNSYASHLADDTTGFWPAATDSVKWDTGDKCSTPPTCSAEYHNALDIDIQVDPADTCYPEKAGEFLAPNLYKSIRHHQVKCLYYCPSFVDPTINYAGTSAIPEFTIATYLHKLGINAWTCGYSRTDGTHLAISGLPADVLWPRGVYVALTYSDGRVEASGGTLAADGTLTGGPFPHDVVHPEKDPTGVVLSLGYTRWRERKLRYLYDKVTWQPDCNEDEGCIDPAGTTLDDNGGLSCFGVGKWIARPKSTQYMVRSSIGMPSDSGGAFTNRALARYVGDDATQPSVLPLIQPSDPASLVQSARYWDHFYRGRFTLAHQRHRTISRHGVSTAGVGQKQLTDATKNWWSDHVNGSFTQKARASITAVTPYTPATPTTPEVLGTATVAVTPPQTPQPATWTVTNDTDASGNGAKLLQGSYTFTTGGNTVTIPGRFTGAMIGGTLTFTYHGTMHTEKGTATSGGTDHLIDNTKDTTDHNSETGCWWNGDRFVNFATAYAGFILEVTRGTGATQQRWRLPITSTVNNGAGGIRINFTAGTGLTITSGDDWQIREPAYELDKWRDRYVTLQSPPIAANAGVAAKASARYFAQVTHSDDVTLYFDGLTLEDGTDAPCDISIGDGWAYTIQEIQAGSVLRWSSTDNEWTVATGADEVRPFVTTPVDFKTTRR